MWPQHSAPSPFPCTMNGLEECGRSAKANCSGARKVSQGSLENERIAGRRVSRIQAGLEPRPSLGNQRAGVNELKKNPVAVGCCAVAVLLAVLVGAGDPGWADSPVGSSQVAHMLEALFPGSAFELTASGEYADAQGDVFVAQTFKGSFTSAGAREILLVAVASPSQASHAQGMYRAKAAVFDMRGRAPVSAVVSFVADEGRLHLFSGRNVEYVLFVGSTTFQGLTEWTGGLFRAGREWVRVWPEDPSFWENAVVEVGEGAIQVFSRTSGAKPSLEGTTRAYELSYTLKWDADAETFVKVSKAP